MRIGRAGQAATSISTCDAASVAVRGRELWSGLMADCRGVAGRHVALA